MSLYDKLVITKPFTYIHTIPKSDLVDFFLHVSLSIYSLIEET